MYLILLFILLPFPPLCSGIKPMFLFNSLYSKLLFSSCIHGIIALATLFFWYVSKSHPSWTFVTLLRIWIFILSRLIWVWSSKMKILERRWLTSSEDFMDWCPQWKVLEDKKNLIVFRLSGTKRPWKEELRLSSLCKMPTQRVEGWRACFFSLLTGITK